MGSTREMAGAVPSRVFGTDGIRGRAGEGVLTPSGIARVFTATAAVLEATGAFPGDLGEASGKCIVVGRDTRDSGGWILDAIATTLLERGYDVVDLGVLPTPGVAFTSQVWEDVRLGVVISASHNPAKYNGIKFFTPTGEKISPQFEKAVEDEYTRENWQLDRRTSGRSGKRSDSSEAAREEYISHLVQRCWNPERLLGRKIVLDAAHGATYEVAPEVFRRLGLAVEVMGDRPDGWNINDGCGALHPERLASAVVEVGADLGLCFDGDGDRMIPVTGSGEILDGDYVLALSGAHFQKADRLPRGKIVATVMSNVGLELALKERGLELLRTDVGDRNVYLEMLDGPHPVGGEQSGHTIFLDDASTGDGILSGLRLLDVLESADLDLAAESKIMTRYPQVLQNVKVAEKIPFAELSGVLSEVEAVEKELSGEGRVLLRYSGTEPLARVMVEGPDRKSTASYAERICATIRDALGRGNGQ